MSEWEFVSEVARRSGCRLLLDVNNIHVNAANLGFDGQRYIEGIDPALVAQFHLGGHEARDAMLVDTHGARCSPRSLVVVCRSGVAHRRAADAGRMGHGPAAPRRCC
jgi:uncharacterized protein (UPF0276 family)